MLKQAWGKEICQTHSPDIILIYSNFQICSPSSDTIQNHFNQNLKHFIQLHLVEITKGFLKIIQTEKSIKVN